MKPGQDLVVAGYAGAAGAGIAALKKQEELLQWFSAEYVEQMQRNHVVSHSKAPYFWKDMGAADWEPAGEGGILTALWNLSGAYETGIQFDLCNIPMNQETVEVCERFDLNPYRLYSEGCTVLAADHGSQLVAKLSSLGIPAAVIGMVTTGIKREICHGDTHGYLDRPQKDQLKKIAPEFFKK